MSRIFGLVIFAMVLAIFAVTVMASEKPTREYQDIMKSNGAIVDLSAGTTSREVSGGVAIAPTSLRQHIRTKDYDGIVTDAAKLKANFAKIETFWTAKKVDDAITFSRAVIKSATDLESAAKAKDDAGIVTAQRTIATACRGCHQAHRIIMLTDNSVVEKFEIKISDTLPPP